MEESAEPADQQLEKQLSLSEDEDTIEFEIEVVTSSTSGATSRASTPARDKEAGVDSVPASYNQQHSQKQKQEETENENETREEPVGEIRQVPIVTTIERSNKELSHVPDDHHYEQQAEQPKRPEQETEVLADDDEVKVDKNDEDPNVEHDKYSPGVVCKDESSRLHHEVKEEWPTAANTIEVLGEEEKIRSEDDADALFIAAGEQRTTPGVLNAALGGEKRIPLEEGLLGANHVSISKREPTTIPPPTPSSEANREPSEGPGARPLDLGGSLDIVDSLEITDTADDDLNRARQVCGSQACRQNDPNLTDEKSRPVETGAACEPSQELCSMTDIGYEGVDEGMLTDAGVAVNSTSDSGDGCDESARLQLTNESSQCSSVLMTSEEKAFSGGNDHYQPDMRSNEQVQFVVERSAAAALEVEQEHKPELETKWPLVEPIQSSRLGPESEYGVHGDDWTNSIDSIEEQRDGPLKERPLKTTTVIESDEGKFVELGTLENEPQKQHQQHQQEEEQRFEDAVSLHLEEVPLEVEIHSGASMATGEQLLVGLGDTSIAITATDVVATKLATSEDGDHDKDNEDDAASDAARDHDEFQANLERRHSSSSGGSDRGAAVASNIHDDDADGCAVSAEAAALEAAEQPYVNQLANQDGLSSSSSLQLLNSDNIFFLDDDDLEREFDEEPEFKRRDVEVKQNKSPRDEYELGEELGRGRFGTVVRCIERASGLQLAAKFVHMRRREDREDVEREVSIMSVLQHKRLLQLYDAFDDGREEMCLITELVEGGELFERIVDDDFDLTEKKAAIFMRQICEGVEYMHSERIVHLDMKPENILCLSRTGMRIKLIDFGLARRLDPQKPIRVLFGTPDFAAPEVLAYETVELATDMWSVGVICYVLLSGLSPFMGDTDIETMANVMRATFDFNDQAFEAISDLAKDFISKLLVRDPASRLKPSECLKHAWLQRGGGPLEAHIRDRRESSFSLMMGAGAGQHLNRLALEQAAMLTSLATASTATAATTAGSSAAPTPPTPPSQLNLGAASSFQLANYMKPRASFGADSSTSASHLSLDKRRLKRYVVRRKWHKTVHAIMALGRMGANLKLDLA
uniref:Myosin light chain kinase, smooth muscle n=1 Tax=Aceria tosichella TaxID=561515 RepID=A0A6G1S7A7_9ACAR